MNLSTILTDKISSKWQQWRDLPNRIADAGDAIFSTEFAKNYRLIRPYTSCSTARLRGLERAIKYAIDRQIPGDVVECGTALGGSAAFMGLTLNRLNSDRQLWVFDTFEGLPPPTAADPDYDQAKFWTGKCRGELSEVENLFRQCGILERSRPIKGLFQDTLPVTEIEKIAVLHVDGDWYESVKSCLEHLYDRVSPGGVIQIDDYGHWAGARKAVTEFFHKRQIDPKLHYLDYTGRQFVKPF